MKIIKIISLLATYICHDPFAYIKKELNAKAIKKIDENLWKVIW